MVPNGLAGGPGSARRSPGRDQAGLLEHQHPAAAVQQLLNRGHLALAQASHQASVPPRRGLINRDTERAGPGVLRIARAGRLTRGAGR
jgi:hypothetical protein